MSGVPLRRGRADFARARPPKTDRWTKQKRTIVDFDTVFIAPDGIGFIAPDGIGPAGSGIE